MKFAENFEKHLALTARGDTFSSVLFDFSKL